MRCSIYEELPHNLKARRPLRRSISVLDSADDPPAFSREEAEAYLVKQANKPPYAGHAIQVTYRSSEPEEKRRRRSGKRRPRH